MIQESECPRDGQPSATEEAREAGTTAPRHSCLK